MRGRVSSIVVTIPKSRLADVAREEQEVAAATKRGEKRFYYWTLPWRPTHLNPGDRCYFVWDKAVRAYHDVLGVQWDAGIARWCVWMTTTIHEITPIAMESFRGFRYWKPGL